MYTPLYTPGYRRLTWNSKNNCYLPSHISSICMWEVFELPAHEKSGSIFESVRFENDGRQAMTEPQKLNLLQVTLLHISGLSLQRHSSDKSGQSIILSQTFEDGITKLFEIKQRKQFWSMNAERENMMQYYENLIIRLSLTFSRTETFVDTYK